MLATDVFKVELEKWRQNIKSLRGQEAQASVQLDAIRAHIHRNEGLIQAYEEMVKMATLADGAGVSVAGAGDEVDTDHA